MGRLNVTLCGIELDNPVIPASGTFGYGAEFAQLYDINMLGTFSFKGTTKDPRFGNPTPRIAECGSGMLNSVGLQNPGVEHVIAQAMSELKNKEDAERYRIRTETAAAKAAAERIEGKTIRISAKAAADQIAGKTIRISAKAGQNGKLFGSVTAKEIAETLQSTFGISVDKRKITVEEIKQYGTYEFEVKLYPGISTQLYVMVGE